MRILAALVALALMLACAPPTNWTDLHSVEELRDAFNHDQGNVRLVLILSPT